MTETHHLPEPTLESIEQVSDGWLKKYIMNYRLPDGGLYIHEAISRKSLEDFETAMHDMRTDPVRGQVPDAVCVVPYTADGRIVIEREFRYGINCWCIQMPAGLIDPGESAETAVERELEEETGYSLLRDENGNAQIHLLKQPGFSSPGMTEECVQMVYALVDNEPSLERNPEPNELIEIFTVQIDELDTFLQTNTTPLSTRAQLALEAFVQEADCYSPTKSSAMR